MKRRSKLSIQVYRAITVTAIGLMIGAASMRVMTVQAQETQKNQEQQSDYQKLDYKVFEDSSERLLEWSDIYILSNEDIRIAKNEIYARHGRRFASTDLQSYFDQMAWYNGTVQPQNFDSGCLNAVEVANISFLDSEQQAGTGSDNKSVVEKEISLQKQEKEMYTAKINDRIGLSSFADTAVVKYNASDELMRRHRPCRWALFMRKMAKFLEISDLTRVLAMQMKEVYAPGIKIMNTDLYVKTVWQVKIIVNMRIRMSCMKMTEGCLNTKRWMSI